MLDSILSNIEYVNNFTVSCDDYGHCAVLYRYLPDVQNCGELNRGEVDQTFNVKIDIQPAKGEDLEFSNMGHMSEDSYKFYYNPYHTDNLQSNSGEPIFIKSSTSEWQTGGYDASIERSHSDIIEWLGVKYVICALQNWSGNNCLGNDECGVVEMQTGLLVKWVDQFGKREANIDNQDYLIENGVLQPL